MNKEKLLKQREYRCKLAIEKGFIYDSETGDIYSRLGNKVLKKDKSGYCLIRFRYFDKTYEVKSHQFAWYYIHKKVVECIDHINRDKADNRLCNLRSVSWQENLFNTNAKGYSFDKKTNKWRSRIYVEGKLKHLGRYDTEEEAKEVYMKAKEEYHKVND